MTRRDIVSSRNLAPALHVATSLLTGFEKAQKTPGRLILDMSMSSSYYMHVLDAKRLEPVQESTTCLPVPPCRFEDAQASGEDRRLTLIGVACEVMSATCGGRN